MSLASYRAPPPRGEIIRRFGFECQGPITRFCIKLLRAQFGFTLMVPATPIRQNSSLNSCCPEACPKRVSEESAGRNPILKAPDLPFKSPLGPSLHTIAKISKTGSKRNRFLERPSLSVSCVGCPVSPKKQLGSHGKVLLDSSGRLFDACHRTR